MDQLEMSTDIHSCLEDYVRSHSLVQVDQPLLICWNGGVYGWVLRWVKVDTKSQNVTNVAYN